MIKKSREDLIGSALLFCIFRVFILLSAALAQRCSTLFAALETLNDLNRLDARR